MIRPAGSLLIAEEDKDSRFLVRTALRDFKIKFIEAGTRQECMDKAFSESPDLVIINYILGSGTGYDLAESFKDKEKLKHIPIIITTLEGFDLAEENPCVAGFVEKPFSRDRLVSTVRDVLGKRMFLPKKEPSSYTAAKKPRTEGGKEKILVADDDENVIRLLQFILCDRFDVDAVRNGGELVEKGVSGEYDLIISDVIMPEFSGWKAARKLRDAGVTAPIIFNSGLVKDRDLYETLRPEGPSAFLLKPFNKEKILSKISEMI